MTILTALTEFYDRLAERGEGASQGHSVEKIGFELVISADGKPLALNDLRDPSEKRPRPRAIAVPKPGETRTSGIKPFFLWDKTAYSLGVIAESPEGIRPGQGKRTTEEHAAFVAFHRKELADVDDDGLAALLAFLNEWQPEDFTFLKFPVEALDQNIVFRLDGERRFLHERPAAVTVWARISVATGETGRCLVTGAISPLARLHPSLKGVAGAKSSGAALVSFNLPAFDSHGKSQGANAPVSEAATFAYGTALNWLLNRDHGRSLRVGDATVVFWADARESGEETAVASENLLVALFGGAANLRTDEDPDEASAAPILGVLEKIAAGRPLPEIDSRLDPQTRVHILGLSPNNARLSVRFWHVDDFGPLVARIAQHWRDLRIEPAPWKSAPAAWALLYETALQRKAKNIPPRLGGELMRAILTGQPYPRTLLAAVVQRIRADGEITGRRAAIAKAVISRIEKEEAVPVALDRENTNPAYRLGRLFALIESAQTAALPGLNTTVKDRYFGAACATPARIFPLLQKNTTHHLAKLRKGDKGGLAHWMEAEIGEIWSGLSDELPRALRMEEQGRFIVGYYHQRFTRKSGPAGEPVVDTED